MSGKYSQDELIQCICENMFEVLPKKWQSAYMVTKLKPNNEIDAKFIYTDENSEHKFQPNNIFAPMNAAKELFTMLSSSTQNKSLMVKLNADNSIEYSILND